MAIKSWMGIPCGSEDSLPLSKMWKVPFRESYCFTFRQWLAQTIVCHIVYRIQPPPPLSLTATQPE